MSFELDEIGFLLKAIGDSQSSIESQLLSLSSSTAQLTKLSEDCAKIINVINNNFANSSDKQLLLSNGINTLFHTVGQRASKVVEESRYLKGKYDNCKDMIDLLTNSIEVIEERNKNQEALVEKIKSNEINLRSSGPEDIEIRALGERPEGIAKIRKAKEAIEKEEIENIINDNNSTSTT
jgi:archaellum component FlaC